MSTVAALLLVSEASVMPPQLTCSLRVDSAPLVHPGASRVFVRALCLDEGEARPVMQTEVRALPKPLHPFSRCGDPHHQDVFFWASRTR
jgi:hypothetical protein